MANLQIRKKSSRTWLHIDGDLGQFILSKFYFSEDLTKFQIVEQGESRRRIYDIVDVYVYDDTNGGAQETFTNITDLSIRLEQLFYPAFSFANGIPTTTTDVTANHFKGNYDVTTNQPILIDGVGQIGDEYKSSLAGTRNFGSGDIILAVNDILAYNGSNWFLKVNNNQSSGGVGVQSVTGTAVDNTDPLNPVINVSLYYTKTKSEVDTLIFNNNLSIGAFYIITDKGLYLEAITGNKLATEGYGEFTNPVYTSPTQIYDPATVSYDTLLGDAYVIWGGKVWKSKNSSVGAGQNIDNLTLDSAYWQTSVVYAGGTIPFGAILSKKVYDKITYDYANDFISSREDSAGNVVKCSFSEYNLLGNMNPLLYFQWGKGYSSNTNTGLGGNKINNSFFDCINSKANRITGNIFNQFSVVQGCEFEINSSFSNCTFISSSINYSFFGGGNVVRCKFINSNISNKTFDSNNINVSFDNYSSGTVENYNSLNGNAFNGDLPTTTTSTTMLVKENGQWKEQSSISPEFADNASAIAGGLTVGLRYRTGDFLKEVY